MRRLLFQVCLLAVCLAAPAFAKEGPYLGIGLLYNDPVSSDISYLDAAIGLNVRFGYNFGPVALEANLMGSTHNDSDPGYTDADFSGVSVDLKIFLSERGDPNQVYFLVGLGGYAIEEYDPFLGTNTELQGSGFNLGAGLEHYFTPHAALNLGLTYRIIRYDELRAFGTTGALEPAVKGDTLSLEVGLNYHF
jgi:opacity protein-like surface antigen